MSCLGGVIEKAVYADTPQNRKLGRVGQEYHRGRGKKEGGSAPEHHPHERVTKKRNQLQKIGSVDNAAEFLKKNVDKWSDYQYGDLDDEKLEAQFDAANKFIKDFKQFDWQEGDEAEAYKEKMESKGYKIVDLGEGSDTYIFAILKKSKKESA